jgi:hypothetical protein
MNLFQAGLPFSYGALYLVFLMGICFTTVVFGVLSGIIFFVCVYCGILRISPVLDILGTCISYFNPAVVSSIETNIRKSLLVEYPDQPSYEGKHIFLFHPHGVLSIAYMFHLGTTITSWITRPIKATILHWLFWFPFAKEVFERLRCVPSDYSSMKAVLDEGESLGVCLGGAREILYTEPETMKLSIAKKSGVFHLALETGTPLVPVLSYGENDVFDLVRSDWLLKFQKILLSYGMCLPIPTLKSCSSWFGIPWTPIPNPIRTVVGTPIEVGLAHKPTDKEVFELREKYFLALKNLYERTRPANYKEDLQII